MKLICLPCAGASANMYFRWKKLLPNSTELVTLELAGRGTRLSDDYIDDFDKQVDDLYHRYFERASWIHEPYILFGHSMGALLCYGILKKIEALNESLRNKKESLPSAMIVSACEAPSVRKPDRFRDTSKKKLIGDLRSKNGTPDIIFEHEELLNMAVDCLKADYKVCGSFQYQQDQRLSTIPLHVFHGLDDDITLKSLESWQNETTTPIVIDTFEGDHFYLKTNQSEERMITKVSDLLSFYQTF